MINKAILVGMIGKDPEIRSVGNVKVATFSVATSEKYKDKDGTFKESTEWHNIVAWSPLAEIVESYATKGSKVYIEGKIKTRKWEDKNGEKRYTTEIIAQTIRLLGGGGDRTQSGEQAIPQGDDNGINPADDLPF